MTGDLCFVLEIVPLRGEKNFKPHPQNTILVALRGYVQNKLLGLVVQRLDNAIHWINRYPADKC